MPSPISLSNITDAIDATIEELEDLDLGAEAQLERAELILYLEGITKIVHAIAKCPAQSYIPRWASETESSS